MRFAVFILLLARFAGAQPSAPSKGIDWKTIDWKAQEPEILRHYSALVQIDSGNPPGNETAVVTYL
jgi:hypothetical protein